MKIYFQTKNFYGSVYNISRKINEIMKRKLKTERPIVRHLYNFYNRKPS